MKEIIKLKFAVVSAVAVGCSVDTTKAPHSRGYSSATSLTVNLVWLLDKCLQHESFQDHHKRLWLWRSQLMLPATQSHLGGAGGGGSARHHRNRRWSLFFVPSKKRKSLVRNEHLLDILRDFIHIILAIVNWLKIYWLKTKFIASTLFLLVFRMNT